MTNHSQTADVGELSQAVANLTDALARTEKRSAHLTRIIHWSLLGGLVLLVVAGFLIAKGVGAAYASFDQFLSTAEEAIGQNEYVQEHVEFSIKKTIVEDNLEDKKRQMTPEEYKAFVDNLARKMTLGEYQTFVVNLTLEMTPEEYKAFVDNLALEMTLEEYQTFVDNLMLEMTPEEYRAFFDNLMLRMTPGEYKAFVNNLTPEEYKAFVDDLTLKMVPEKDKILLIETLARTLQPEKYKTLLVEALARILPPEKYKALFVETLARTLPPEKEKALLVEALARTVPPEEYKAFVDNLPTKEYEAITRQVVIERAVNVLADVFVVMRRVREDSDSIHRVLRDGFEKLGDDPSLTLEKIGKQLETMNNALAAMPPMKDYMGQMNQKMSSVPAMAAQMDLMNRNMASMTTSIGSTMGRMGKWMPW